MSEPTGCAPARSCPDSSFDSAYCERCDLLVGLAGLHVVDVAERAGKRGPWLRVVVESAATLMACIWHHVSTKPADQGGRGPKELTGMVDLTRGQHGRTRARLLDLVPGRSGAAYADWLKARSQAFRDGIGVAAGVHERIGPGEQARAPQAPSTPNSPQTRSLSTSGMPMSATSGPLFVISPVARSSTDLPACFSTRPSPSTVRVR